MLIAIFVTAIIAIISAVYSPIYIGFAVIFVGVVFWLYKRKDYMLLLKLALVFGFFFFYAYFAIQIRQDFAKELSHLPKNVYLSGYVDTVYSYGFLYKVTGDKKFAGKKMLVYKKNHGFAFGDKLSVSGSLLVDKTPTRLELLSKPIASVLPRQIIKVSDSSLAWVYQLKNRFIQGVKSYLPEYYSNFLIGLLIGVNGIDLDSDLQNTFLNLGLLHMLVVSGAQVALLTSVLLQLLGLFRLSKTTKFIIVLLFNMIFLLFVGGEISVLRAVIMMQITIFLNYDNRAKTSLQVLSLTGIVMLLFSPGMLFSLSFIMSFCATFAVVEVSPLIQKMLDQNESIPAIIREPLGISLGPILITSPIIFLINYRFDVFALFANMLFAPVVEIVVIVGFAGMLFSAFFGLLAWPLLKFVFGLMVVMKVVADLLYSLPGRSIYFSQAFFINVAVYYLLFFVWLYKKDLFRKYWSAFIAIIIVTVGINWWFIQELPEKEFCFYNNDKWFSVVYIYKDKSLMLVSEQNSENERYLLKKIHKPDVSIKIDISSKEDKGKYLAMQKGITWGDVKITNNDELIVLQDKNIRINIVLQSTATELPGIVYYPKAKKVSKKMESQVTDIFVLPCKESEGQVVSSRKRVVGIFFKSGKYQIYQ